MRCYYVVSLKTLLSPRVCNALLLFFISIFLHRRDGAPVVVRGWHHTGSYSTTQRGGGSVARREGEEQVPICLVGTRVG
jgi:hypothetical protein